MCWVLSRGTLESTLNCSASSIIIGFNITYPTEYGKVYKHGEMAHLTWKVDPNLAVPADIITRIRVMNDQQRNIYTVGGNISKCSLIKAAQTISDMYRP